MFGPEIIERFKALPTPFYYYDLQLLKRTLAAAKAAAEPPGFQIHYALKANWDERMLAMFRDQGYGADCVSGGEVKTAIDMGFPTKKIVFAGVGKSDEEILLALEKQIFCFNCESLQELKVINTLAQETGRVAAIALRVNPDLDPRTHHYITTGKEENKFGINVSYLQEALTLLDTLKRLRFMGLHFHIGSQITDLAVFKNLCLRVNDIQRWLRERHVEPEHLNLGGGLGVDYHHPDAHAIPDFSSYFAVFKRFLELRPGQAVHFELGRALVAQCGTLVSRVLYIKPGLKTRFAVLDAGMTELIRPALYQAYHKIENLSSQTGRQTYDVVGPVCESSDCFGKAVELPETRRGDLIAIRTAGAYAQVMASRYNMRQPAGTVYSD